MTDKIPVVDQYDFLEHRREQEKKHWRNTNGGDPLDSILTVEINTTELCNRTCVFCPRHDPEVFPNRNLHMTLKGAEIIAEELSDNNFSGKISFSGFGENLLNPNFRQIVKEFRFNLPQATLECNTNGDKLTPKYLSDLMRNGLDLIYINLYDGIHQMDHFKKIIKEARVKEEQYKFRKRGRGQRKKHAIAQGGSARSFDQDLPLEFSERVVIYADKKVSKAEIRLRQINYNLKLCKDRLKITEDTLNKLNEEQNNIDSKIQYLLRERASLTVTKLKEV